MAYTHKKKKTISILHGTVFLSLNLTKLFCKEQAINSNPLIPNRPEPLEFLNLKGQGLRLEFYTHSLLNFKKIN